MANMLCINTKNDISAQSMKSEVWKKALNVRKQEPGHQQVSRQQQTNLNSHTHKPVSYVIKIFHYHPIKMIELKPFSPKV